MPWFFLASVSFLERVIERARERCQEQRHGWTKCILGGRVRVWSQSELYKALIVIDIYWGPIFN